jgi:hypothetical protein
MFGPITNKLKLLLNKFHPSSLEKHILRQKLKCTEVILDLFIVGDVCVLTMSKSG